MSKKPLYDPQSGIHRAKIWEIGFYALNNTSTNTYMFIFMYITYFLTGIVGVGVVLAGSIGTIMRIWDGVTDPFVGYIVDKTNGKFGKNRPFILLGNVIMFIAAGAIFLTIPSMPQALRFPAYVVLYGIYIIGYTAQCVVTKSAQSCLTNDPKQRPVFAIFDSIFNTVLFSLVPLLVTMYLVPKYGDAAAWVNPAMYVELWLIFAAISAVFAVFGVIGLWRKDRTEFFGTGKAQRIGFKDYWEVLRKNRAIQMLVVAASTDKLSGSIMRHAVVTMMIFGVIVGDFNQSGLQSAVLSLPTTVLIMGAILFVAVRLGQRKALLYGTLGAMTGSIVMFLAFILLDPTTLDFSFTSGLTLFTGIYIVSYLVMMVCNGMAGNIVIPMTADCADYEVYRSGRYVPGLMGTLFSFVDKLISSFASTIVALAIAAIGFTETQPTQDTPLTPDLFWVTMALFFGAPMIGWICNLVAMKFYPLTKEKMVEIQARIAEIKRGAVEESAK